MRDCFQIGILQKEATFSYIIGCGPMICCMCTGGNVWARRDRLFEEKLKLEGSSTCFLSDGCSEGFVGGWIAGNAEIGK